MEAPSESWFPKEEKVFLLFQVLPSPPVLGPRACGGNLPWPPPSVSASLASGPAFSRAHH